MPPKRSLVEPVITRGRTKKRKSTSTTDAALSGKNKKQHSTSTADTMPNNDITTVPQTNANSSSVELSPQSVETIVNAVVATMERRGLVSKQHSLEPEPHQNEQTPAYIAQQVPHVFATTAQLADNNATHTVTSANTVHQPITGPVHHPGSIPSFSRVTDQTCSSPGPSINDLSPEAKNILNSALSDRTKAIYLQNWNTFTDFCCAKQISVELPVSEQNLINYLAHLCTKGYRTNTIATHASALAYINKYFGFKDFTDSFLVKQFFKGASQMQEKVTRSDTRLPITYDLLHRIVTSLPSTIKHFYNRIIFSTMCILAFHGFLRIGELCRKTAADTKSHAILLQDVLLVDDSNGTKGVQIHLNSFKHSIKPVTLLLPAQTDHPSTCPFLAVKHYLQYFKHRDGPFFQFLNGEAVTYSFFNEQLRNAIAFLGFDISKYKSHSFRIGAATNAVIQGHSEETIKRLGRWKSNALQNYIRLPLIKMNNQGSS